MVWGPEWSLKRTLFPPLEVFKIIDYIWQSDYQSLIFLHQKYVVEGLSIGQIATQIFSSTSTVHKYLKRYNILLRVPDGKSSSRLKYGESLSGRQVKVNEAEARAIKKMKALRFKGFSYWKVADVFNAMNVPTKTSRGRWHAKSIQKTLNNG